MLIAEVVQVMTDAGGTVLPPSEGVKPGGVWAEVDACGSILTLYAPDLHGSEVRWSYEEWGGVFRSTDEAEDFVAFCANGMLADFGGAA